MARLGVLHQSKTGFSPPVNLELLLKRYFDLLGQDQQLALEADYQSAGEKIESLSPRDATPVPSHNDLVFENILRDDSNRIWLIDWEYASMASPYWDLATLCNSANLDELESALLLQIYEQSCARLDIGVLMDYRFILGLLTTCWMGVFSELNAGTDRLAAKTRLQAGTTTC